MVRTEIVRRAGVAVAPIAIGNDALGNTVAEKISVLVEGGDKVSTATVSCDVRAELR